MGFYNPSRSAPNDRKDTDTNKKPSARTHQFLSPFNGLFTNVNEAQQPPNTAAFMENFWPEPSGIEPRGGLYERFDVGSSVNYLFEHRDGATVTMFAATDSDVYEFNSGMADATTLSVAIPSITSSNYSSVSTETSGGVFTSIVNGYDDLQLYDGTTWQAVNSSSTPHSITGVSTSSLVDVWAYRNRQYFIEKSSMNAWCGGVNSVSGVLNKIPLGGVFNKGGNLVFGATVSVDSGEGVDDRCVFITDQGEIAIYQGSDPTSSSDWSLVGVFEISEPMDKNAHFKVGGDLVIVSKKGVIPLSSVVNTDESNLELKSFVNSVQPDWESQILAVGNQDGWGAVKIPSKNMVMIYSPYTAVSDNKILVLNTTTEAISFFTGWAMSSVRAMEGLLYVGTTSGKICLGDTGGTDLGLSFVCKATWQFSDLNTAGRTKFAKLLKITTAHYTPFNIKIEASSDYNTEFSDAPNAAPMTSDEFSLWDSAEWDVSSWGSSNNKKVRTDIASVCCNGDVVAPQIQITSSSTSKLVLRILSGVLIYTVGGVFR